MADGNMASLLLADSDGDSDDDSVTETATLGTVPTTTAAPMPAVQPSRAPAPAPVAPAPSVAITAPLPAPAPVAVALQPTPANVPAPAPLQRTPIPNNHGMMPRHNVSVAPPVGAPSSSTPMSAMSKKAQQEKLAQLYKQPVQPVPSKTHARGAGVVSQNHATHNQHHPSATSHGHSQHNNQRAHQPHQPSQPHKTYHPTATNTSTIPSDAFEPTPIREFKKNIPSRNHPMHNTGNRNRPIPHVPRPHHPQHSQHPMQSAPRRVPVSQQPPNAMPTSITQPRMVPNTSLQSASEQKSRKEQFLMFTRVLMKYLEQKNPDMHTKAKEVIRDCAKKNKEGDPKFSSLSASMQSHLQKLVGPSYWKKAEEYLRQYMTSQYIKNKGIGPEEAKKKATLMARSAASPLDAGNPITHHHQQHHIDQTQQRIRSQPPSVDAAHRMKLIRDQERMRELAQKKAREAQQQQAEKEKLALQQKKLLAQQQSHQPVQHQQAEVPKRSTSKKKKDSTTGAKGVVRGSSKSSTAPTPNSVPPSATSASGKKKKSLVKKSAAASASATSSVVSAQASTAAEKAALAPPKEYSEVMEMLDHVVDYDVSSCAIILGSDCKKRGLLNISEEQRKLIYNDFGMTKVGPRKGLYGNRGTSEGAKFEIDTSVDKMLSSNLPLYMRGWGDRNIVSSRAVWAKLRLVEEEQEKLQDISLPSAPTQPDKSIMTPLISQSNQSVVIVETQSQPGTEKKSANSNDVVSESEKNKAWFNEEKAEEDEAMALISEATQQYIKTVLEGAINCASKRLNLDGIRLWHQQHAAAAIREKEVQVEKEKAQKEDQANAVTSADANGNNPTAASRTAAATTSNVNGDPKNKNIWDPPLFLRLGCDTRRQFSQLQGNAAKTFQRLEEAIGRNPDGKMMDQQTMSTATSMTELSKIPKLPEAAQKADYNAKRTFEVYGGKESGEPPLGRIPKKARIMTKDFRTCLKDPAFVMGRKRARVVTTAFV